MPLPPIRNLRWFPFLLVTVPLAIIGGGFLGGGLAFLVGLNQERAKTIRKVNTAVTTWENPTAATGWRQFQLLNASVVLTQPASGPVTWNNNATCQSHARTIPLSPANCPTDTYYEEANRYQSVKQLSFCALALDRTELQQCNMQASFQVWQPGDSVPTNLVTLSTAVSPAGVVSMEMLKIGREHGCDGNTRDCNDGDYGLCKRRCLDHFNGSLYCGLVCITPNVFVYSLGVKLQYTPGTTSPFSLDMEKPPMGPPSAGANALPSGYTLNKPGTASLQGATWTYEGLSYGSDPGSLLFQIRSSSDPYLAYLAATNGVGSFASDRATTLIVGALFLALGGCFLLLVLYFVACTAWGLKLALAHEDEPRDRARSIAWGFGVALLERPQQSSGNNATPLTVVARPMPRERIRRPATPRAGTPPPAGSDAYPPASHSSSHQFALSQAVALEPQELESRSSSGFILYTNEQQLQSSVQPRPAAYAPVQFGDY